MRFNHQGSVLWPGSDAKEGINPYYEQRTAGLGQRSAITGPFCDDCKSCEAAALINVIFLV